MGKGLTIALAAESEAPACLALIPEAQDVGAEFLIAKLDGQFAGAAAISWCNWAVPAGFPIAIYILASQRSQGVGRALLREAAALASQDTNGFWSASPVHTDSSAAGFMQACGFQQRRSTHYFRAKFDVFSEHLTPLLGRMKAHGRIPANVYLAPLSEAPLEEISWLVSTEFGGGPFRTLHGLQRRSQGAMSELNDRSVALLHDGEVAGVMLWKVEDRDGRPTAVVEARVVAPRWRNGWPNLVMLESVLIQGQAEGLAEFIFHCDDTVHDTLSLARRSAAVEIDQNALYYYAIDRA